MRTLVTFASLLCLILAVAGEAWPEGAPDPRLESILDSAMTVPLYESGEFRGLKIDRIKPGRFFHLLGVQPGDVIVAYDEVRLDSLTKTSELFDRLVSGEPYVLEIRRGELGEQKVLLSGPPPPAA